MCHACGIQWGGADSEVKEHRATCKPYDAYCAALATVTATRVALPMPPAGEAFSLRSTDGALYVDTPNGPIRITSDPTVRPGQAVFSLPPGGWRMAPSAIGELAKVPDDKEFARDYLGEWKPVVNGMFHIEPDPPDLAQRQAARVLARQQEEITANPVFVGVVTSYYGQRAFFALDKLRAPLQPGDRLRVRYHDEAPFRTGEVVVTRTWGDAVYLEAPAHVGIPAIAMGDLVYLVGRSEPSIDPLDVEYDGATLRALLNIDDRRRDERNPFRTLTPAQRAAVSAHWSAELRAKVAAGQAAALQSERHRITCDPRDPIDLED